MNAKVDTSEYRLDPLKWVFIIALIAVGVIGNSYYSEVSLLYRVPALLVGAIVAAFVVSQTAKGASLVVLLKESIVEVRKVVWPSVPETHQTTAIVVVVVLVMSLILWGLDSSLGWVASKILG